ncbi:NADH dehydrogenase [ubiquinone] 1 beta subcomplex subunit 8, mitochondrial [Eleutherodactylus coqui]|uniref:NADH dehydrogenase [ubiquinone] 1 beta subcomplex subunit 8, mitochondrial n=1 Tax=Eleutherodactylus coqui TaxID=57060 RepID=UPI003462173F
MAALRAGLLAVVTRKAALASVAGRGAGRFLQCCSVRAASDLPKDLLPGPYPKTKAERAAAAKKYNMILEDYKPYPDNGQGYGDYPMLPDKSQEEKDPNYKWDMPIPRRNWGETMHWDFDKFMRVRVDTTPTPEPFGNMCRVVVIFMGIIFGLFYLGQAFPSFMPAAPKQYPYSKPEFEYNGDLKPSTAQKNYIFKE